VVVSEVEVLPFGNFDRCNDGAAMVVIAVAVVASVVAVFIAVFFAMVGDALVFAFIVVVVVAVVDIVVLVSCCVFVCDDEKNYVDTVGKDASFLNIKKKIDPKLLVSASLLSTNLFKNTAITGDGNGTTKKYEIIPLEEKSPMARFMTDLLLKTVSK